VAIYPSVVAQPYLGFWGGVSYSKLSGDSPENAFYKGLLSFAGGFNIDVKISKSIYLSFQPSFLQEGTKVFYNIPFVYEPVDSARIRLNYVSMPVLLKVSSTNQRFYAIGGAEASYLTGSLLKTGTYEGSLDEDVSDVNISVVFGAGLRIPVGFPRLCVELRYAQGIVNLTNQTYKESYIPRVKSSGFKLNIGLEVPLKKIKTNK
jgi:hypothetical protein